MQNGTPQVYVIASETNTNVYAAMGAGKWAFPKETKSHGKISAGDYVMLYATQSQSVLGVGIVTSPPDMCAEVANDVWAGVWHHPFCFRVLNNPNRMTPVTLETLNQLPSVKTNGGRFGRVAVLNNNSAPSKITYDDLIAVWQLLEQ